VMNRGETEEQGSDIGMPVWNFSTDSTVGKILELIMVMVPLVLLVFLFEKTICSRFRRFTRDGISRSGLHPNLRTSI
jgi:hypothetical protein